MNLLDKLLSPKTKAFMNIRKRTLIGEGNSSMVYDFKGDQVISKFSPKDLAKVNMLEVIFPAHPDLFPKVILLNKEKGYALIEKLDNTKLPALVNEMVKVALISIPLKDGQKEITINWNIEVIMTDIFEAESITYPHLYKALEPRYSSFFEYIRKMGVKVREFYDDEVDFGIANLAYDKDSRLKLIDI